MKLAQFQKQTLEQRFDTLFKWGFMMTREEYLAEVVVIYSINDFFVKLILDKETNEFVEIRGFDPADLPFQYYQQIASDCPLMPSAIQPVEIPFSIKRWKLTEQKELIAA